MTWSVFHEEKTSKHIIILMKIIYHSILVIKLTLPIFLYMENKFSTQGQGSPFPWISKIQSLVCEKIHYQKLIFLIFLKNKIKITIDNKREMKILKEQSVNIPFPDTTHTKSSKNKSLPKNKVPHFLEHWKYDHC